MGFLDDLIKRAVPEPIAPSPFRAVICGLTSAHVENVKEIQKFTREEIVLSLRKGRVILTGKNLSVERFFAGDVMISGKVTGLFAEGVEP